MAPFTGDAVSSAVKTAVETQPPAHAGSQNNAEDHGEALAGALQAFRQGETVGVVFHGHGAAQLPGDILLEGFVDQAGDVGIDHAAGPGIDDAGNANANGAVMAGCLTQGLFGHPNRVF